MVAPKYHCAAVNLLGPEVLSHIFLIGLTQSHPHQGWCAAVSKVCRYWRDVALGTPALWTRIYLRKALDLQMLPVLLARAKSADTEIHIHGSFTDDDRGGQQSWRSALQAIVDHSARITVLDARIFCRDDAPVAIHYFDLLAVSRLETMTFLVEKDTADMAFMPNNLLQLHAPKLRSFTTNLIPRDWAATALRCLHYFVLHLPQSTRDRVSSQSATAFGRAHAVGVLDVLRLIANAGELKTLRILGGQLAPATALPPLNSGVNRYLQDVCVTSDAPQGGEHLFEQLLAIPAVSCAEKLALGCVSAPLGAVLLAQLPADNECAIRLQAPADGFMIYRPVKALWRVDARSRSSGAQRTFAVVVRTGTELHEACGVRLRSITSLSLLASQWSELSAALADIAMPAVRALDIVYSFQGHSRSGEQLRLHKLHGHTIVRLPALHTIRISVEGLGTLPATFSPPSLSIDVLMSLLAVLGFDALRLPLLRLVNIVPKCNPGWILDLVDECVLGSDAEAEFW